MRGATEVFESPPRRRPRPRPRGRDGEPSVPRRFTTFRATHALVWPQPRCIRPFCHVSLNRRGPHVSAAPLSLVNASLHIAEPRTMNTAAYGVQLFVPGGGASRSGMHVGSRFAPCRGRRPRPRRRGMRDGCVGDPDRFPPLTFRASAHAFPRRWSSRLPAQAWRPPPRTSA